MAVQSIRSEDYNEMLSDCSLPGTQIRGRYGAVDLSRGFFAGLGPIFKTDSHDSKLINGLGVLIVVRLFRSQAGKRFSATNFIGCCDKTAHPE